MCISPTYSPASLWSGEVSVSLARKTVLNKPWNTASFVSPVFRCSMGHETPYSTWYAGMAKWWYEGYRGTTVLVAHVMIPRGGNGLRGRLIREPAGRKPALTRWKSPSVTGHVPHDILAGHNWDRCCCLQVLSLLYMQRQYWTRLCREDARNLSRYTSRASAVLQQVRMNGPE